MLNAVNYIRNISMGKVSFAKMNAFMRKKELFTCKENVYNIIDRFIDNSLIQVRENRENSVFQIANKIDCYQIS